MIIGSRGWRSRIALAALFFLQVSVVSAYAQEAAWRYQRLDLEVILDPSESRFEVHGRAVYALVAPAASDLSLGVNTRVPALRMERLEVTTPSAHVEMQADSPLHRARIVPAGPLRRGDSIAVEFLLVGRAAAPQLVLRDSIALASWVEGWYPIPLGPGDAMRTWAAPGRTRFVLPTGWRAVSNGRLIASREDPDSGTVEVWETLEPLHRSFAAGPYRVARAVGGGGEIGVYVIRADTAAAARQARALAQAIAALERVWGPYPYDGYEIAEIPDHAVTWAASSEQGFIMATSSQFGPAGNLPLFAHEAAHAWWGNLVSTTGVGSLVVSESLAQYGAVLAIEALEGHDAMAEFLRFSRTGYNPLQSALGYFEIVRRGGDRPLAQLSNGPWDHNLSDAKGHWFYHMLRQRVGDEVFFRTLRQILRDYSGRVISLDEVRTAFVDAAPGDTALAGFLSQWLDRTGAPVLEPTWWARPGNVVHLEILQRQPDLYDLDIEVEIELINGHRLRRTVRAAERQQTFELRVHARPVALRMDPGHRLLFWRPEYGPPPAGLRGPD